MLLLDAELANGPHAARDARQRVSRLEVSLSQRRASDVALLVSELVTNSYRHAGLVEGDAIRLRVLLDGGTLRIEVADRGMAGSPSIRDPDPDGGWGLRIVSELSDRWGVESGPAGTTVWFELESV